MIRQATDKKNIEPGQEKLQKLLKNAHLPTLPTVAQKLVELCQDENADFATFARVIESDAGLATRILRVTNSAYFGLRHKATTLERAISALGLKYVKSISLGFHLANALGKFDAESFDMEQFWKQSLLRAVLGRQIATVYCPARCEEAFLIGLVQDCGIPLLVEALGERYAQIWRGSLSSPASLFNLEREVFEVDHLTAAAAIVQQWELPELLAMPIRTHHRKSQSQPSMAEQVQLCQISYFVGTLPLNNPDSFSEEDLLLADFCKTAFDLDKKNFAKILEQTRHEFVTIAQIFGDILPDQLDTTELISQARDLLSDYDADTMRDVFNLEREAKKLKEQCDNLSVEVQECRQKAKKDALTGLATRDPLEAYLDSSCKKVQLGQTSLAVFFIDIDELDSINDMHGRDIGDQVIKALADLLGNLFASSGCVARYGGDEMVVAFMGLSLKQAVDLGAGTNRKIKQIDIADSDGKNTGGISCSIGLLYCELGSNPGSAGRAIELAENQMCQVRQHDKDDLRFQILAAENEPAKQAEK